MAKKKTHGEKTADHLVSMLEEASDHRARVLENVIGLVAVGAVDAILTILVDRGCTRFLLEDEISLLRLFVKKANREDCRLN